MNHLGFLIVFVLLSCVDLLQGNEDRSTHDNWCATLQADIQCEDVEPSAPTSTPTPTKMMHRLYFPNINN